MNVVRYPVEEERKLKEARRFAAIDFMHCMDHTDAGIGEFNRRRFEDVKKAEDAFALALGEYHIAVAVEAKKRGA